MNKQFSNLVKRQAGTARALSRTLNRSAPSLRRARNLSTALTPFGGFFNRSPDDPFRKHFDRLQKEMDDLWSVHSTSGFGQWNPSVELNETDSHFLIDVELPGVKEEDVSVELHKGVLTVSGKKSSKNEKKDGDKVVFSERSYGSFRRSWSLPDNISEEDIEAEFTNGVLHLKVVKKDPPADQAAKKINITRK